MSSKLPYVFLCCIFVQISALQELKFVQVITANTYFKPELFFREGLHDGKAFESTNEFDYKTLLSETKDMPNQLKMEVYDLGRFLRSKYEALLGDVYVDEKWELRTTEFPVSMITGLLINAGVWPPADVQKWHTDLEWQPIPTNYKEMHQDRLLLGTLCPNFKTELNPLIKDKSLEYVSPILYEHLIHYISNQSDIKISNPLDVATLYHVLQSMEYNGQRLPAWAKDIYPDGSMKNITLMSYELLSITGKQKQLNGGTFLSNLMNNFLSHYNGMNDTRKMMISTGDIRNVIGILKDLNLMSSPHIPNWSSALIFELYNNNETSEYEVKVNYYTGSDKEIISLKVGECGEFCNIDKFRQFVEDVIPKHGESSLCGVATSAENNHKSSSESTRMKNTFNFLWLLIIVAFFY